MTRDGDTRGATAALPPSCATAPGLVRAHPQGTGFAAAPQDPQLLSSSQHPKSCLQQHQGSFPSQTCQEQELSRKPQPP